MTLKQYETSERDCQDDVKWMRERPLFWENEHIYISHAGISEMAENPFNEDSQYSVLWNRSPLKNIQKLQIIGHTPVERPTYDEGSNAWNIDTGATYGRYLTGLKLRDDGTIIDFYREDTDYRDL